MNIKQTLLTKLENAGFITIEDKTPIQKVPTLEQVGKSTVMKKEEKKVTSLQPAVKKSEINKIISPNPSMNENKEIMTLSDIINNMSIVATEHQQESLMLREQALTLKEKLFELKCVKHELVHHPIFSHIKTKKQLQSFMSWHVFAVWDFMSLTKRLQQDLTCTSLPWMPNKYEYAAHLINEIVLGEESDILPNGGYMSHFGLYLKAMQEVGASTKGIDEFIDNLQKGKSLEQALSTLPQALKDFVSYTIDVAKNKNLYAVLGAFFYGRENVIPDMFQNLLNSWHIDESQAPMFVYYLKRHIELDAGEHGPAAEKLIEIVTEKNTQNIEQVLDCAISAVKMRIRLWDGILQEISHC